MTRPVPRSQRESVSLRARQQHLLALLRSLGGRVGNIDFQKLLFLYCQQEGADAGYEFVPYRFGAFSFSCYADRRKLIERGYLVNNEQIWQLTEAGKEAVALLKGSEVNEFAQRYRRLRGDALVAETYRSYPYYAIRSEVAKRVLMDDQETLRKIEAERPTDKANPLSTIGYEGRTLEQYLNTLLCGGVTLLCDVRRNPISRKYGFAKSTLANACNGVGIRYEHLPELGIASEERDGLQSQADYDRLFARYARHSLPKQGQILGKIRTWIRSGERVALTCYERLPHQCHRHSVAKALAPGLGKGFATRHL